MFLEDLEVFIQLNITTCFLYEKLFRITRKFNPDQQKGVLELNFCDFVATFLENNTSMYRIQCGMLVFLFPAVLIF